MTATDATEPGTGPADDTSTDVAPAHRHPKAHQRAGRLGRWIDSRTGIARVGRGALNKVFPNHWSFLLGEIALYSFVVLLLTGIYLTLFFDADSTGMTTYDGSYGPMQGVQVSEAYNSALEISFDVKGGLLVRQIHHWAALVFVGAIVLHLCRVFFTGAFRRPRELNWVVGCTLFMLAVVNGFAGYSLLDDQLSGTGLRIGYSVLISIPVIGPWLGSLIFGGNFPGDDVIARLYPIHILVVPLLIIAMLTVHLTVLIRHKHTHFPGKGARDDNVVGERLWPTYVFKAGALFFCVFGALALLGGIAQINPVWLYGPFRAEDVSSASQPDWYMGWLEGALRLMPGWETRIAGFTIPNPFYAGVVPAAIVFGGLYAWPWIERRVTKDHAEHHVLDRPRDVPWRTAIGVGVLAFTGVLGFAGSDDVLVVTFGLSVNQAVWFFRVALFALPVISGFVAYRLCIELQRRDGPPPLPTVPVPDTETDGSAGTQDPALVGDAGGGQRHDGSDPANA